MEDPLYRTFNMFIIVDTGCITFLYVFVYYTLYAL